jgi:hypothetical protein
VLILLAAMTAVWTWPLALHLRTHIPGIMGDNVSFLWNLWWMRRVMASDGLQFFHSAFLLAPFGVDLVNHPHTALQGVISATALSRLSLIAAENLYILVSVFLNAAVAYALAFDITRSSRASALTAVAFGSSPYVAAHLLGHFDLLSAWVIPAFALCLRRALAQRGRTAAIGCGVLLAIAAYTAYYHVVYLSLFALAYGAASVARMEVERRRPSQATFAIGRAALALLVLDGLVVLWALMSGGATAYIFDLRISIREIHNPLTLAWGLVAVWLSTRWRVRLRVEGASVQPRRALGLLLVALTAFVVCAAPVIVDATRLSLSGRYVSPVYFWRSAPRGVDLLAPLMGNPYHPLTGGAARRLYALAGLDRIEAVGWLGIVPLALLLLHRGHWANHEEAYRWKVVSAVFALWALGPFLTIAGSDTALPLPETFMRFVPIVSNARVPGRAMVVVYLALGVLMALRLSALNGRWKRPVVQRALVICLAMDYLGSPIPLTALDRPLVYERLGAIQDDGAVVEVPMGIGDGLSGIGDQDREMLYYATIHGHPVVGGFIGRMPPGVAESYMQMPIVGNLLRLSSGQPLRDEPSPSTLPFRYVVITGPATLPALTSYVQSRLSLELLAAADGRALYAVKGVRPLVPR